MFIKYSKGTIKDIHKDAEDAVEKIEEEKKDSQEEGKEEENNESV